MGQGLPDEFPSSTLGLMIGHFSVNDTDRWYDELPISV